MSRIEFGGHGDPIPNIALPDPNLSSDLPIQSLELVDGALFEKADWVALGYTHYEVWCIGAAGGLGANPGQVVFPEGITQQPAPSDVWAYYLEESRSYDLDLNPPKNFDTDYYTTVYIPGNPNHPVGGVPGVDYGWPYTHHQAVEYFNPEHLLPKTTVLAPFTADLGLAFGGGGGGGGLQVVSGALADLSDSVPISVGKVGANAEPGQILVNGVYAPDPVAPYPVNMSTVYGTGSWDDRFLHRMQLENLMLPWARTYVGPSIAFLPPQAGDNGGASAFGDICQASGGKGGNPAVKWSGGLLIIDGAGGEGGIGGQIASGGGAPGSITSPKGADGVWDGEIGSGGGGGHGGTSVPQHLGPLPGV